MPKTKLIIIASLAALFLGSLAVVLFALRAWSTINVVANKPANNGTNLPTITPTPTPDPDRPFSILLLGYGGVGHEGGKNTDSIMLVKVDPKQQTTTLISIPRDLWVPLPLNGDDVSWYKINAAYPIGSNDRLYVHKKIEYTGEAGGGQMAKYIVSQVTGIPVDYFISLDFAGFEKVINTLGNIEVLVDQPFEDPYYPIGIATTDPCGKSAEEIQAVSATMSGEQLEHQFMCRYENLHFDQGLQIMDGATALKYARSRHSTVDGGDFNRARRQRIVLESVKQKVVSIGFIPKIIPTIQTLSKHIQTDLDILAIDNLLARFTEFSAYPITQLALTDQNVLVNAKSSDGLYILNPVSGMGNWSAIQDYLSPPASPTPAPTLSENP